MRSLWFDPLFITETEGLATRAHAVLAPETIGDDETTPAAAVTAAEIEPVAGAEPTPETPHPIWWGKEDVASISFTRLLEERPDVMKAFQEAFNGPDHDRHSTAWTERVGGDTPEAFASYWYKAFGRYEGYAQGETTAGDNISLEKILQDRPDVLNGYHAAFAASDPHSEAWIKRVGGDTAQDYARYWYDKYGKWEGYSQTDKAAAEGINAQRLLDERPDVFKAFFTEFYGDKNDRKSGAWVERVGGDTVEDYAKYWFVTYGQRAGYNQRPAEPAAEAPSETPAPAEPSTPSGPAPPVEDPSLDPWNHPSIYPDWTPPYPGWTPPAAGAASIAEPDPASIGRSLIDTDPMG